MSSAEKEKNGSFVIAIPVADGKLCMHFGHCQQFALLEVDRQKKQVLNTRQLDPPEHQPGVYPRWLRDEGASLIIAGGMGQRAQNIFVENGIEVLVGVSGDSPENVAQRYLEGEIESGDNLCDH